MYRQILKMANSDSVYINAKVTHHCNHELHSNVEQQHQNLCHENARDRANPAAKQDWNQLEEHRVVEMQREGDEEQRVERVNCPSRADSKAEGGDGRSQQTGVRRTRPPQSLADEPIAIRRNVGRTARLWEILNRASRHHLVRHLDQKQS